MARPKKQKLNNLSLATVEKVSKKIEKTRIHVINSGEYAGEQVTFQPLFDDLKIEALLTEFGQLMNESDKEDIKVSQNMQLYLIYILIIKHFTHFKNDIPSHLLDKEKQLGILKILDHFRKTGLLKECIDVMFIPSEVRKVLDRMTDVAAAGLLAMNLDKEMLDKLEKLREQNNDVFKKLDEINIETNVVETSELK